MVLKGVGAAKIKPKLIGRFIGMNELKRSAQGMIFFVSGWIAVDTTVSATLISFISLRESMTSLLPILSNISCSLAF